MKALCISLVLLIVLITIISAEIPLCLLRNSTQSNGEFSLDCFPLCECINNTQECWPACEIFLSHPTEDCPNPILRAVPGECCKQRFCQACPEGRYGPGCNKTCGQCLARWCNITTGDCPDHLPFCLPGYSGPGCRQACPPGQYGSNCFRACGRCAGGQCKATTGECMSRSPRCLPGFQGLRCEFPCPDGTYGSDCAEACGDCTDRACNITSGICPPATPRCKSGFEGELCKQACRPGRFGPGCQWDCGGCAAGSTTCRPQDGRCPETVPRCKPGYEGELCKVCKSGTWGEECKNNCSSFCSRGPLECDKRDGTCLGGCVTGYNGHTCTETELSSGVIAALKIGGSVGGFLLIVVVTCAVCLYIRSRQRRPKNEGSGDTYLTPVAPGSQFPSVEKETLHRTDTYEIPVSRPGSRDVPDEQYTHPDITVIQDGMCSLYEIMLPKPDWDVKIDALEISNRTTVLGSYGETTMATWYPTPDTKYPTTVGLKRLPNSHSEDAKNFFNTELEKLRSLDRCMFILTLLGTCVDPYTGDTLLLLEWTEEGSVLEYLTRPRTAVQAKNELSEDRLWKVCVDVATAMNNLSSKQVTGVDLAAETVLLDRNFDAKVTGLVHFKDESEAGVRKARESMRWTAPESIHQGRQEHSSSSDVWSFGVLMWEIYSLGQTPYSDIPVEELHEKLQNNYRLGHPPKASTHTYVLMTECWSADPSTRPTFKEIAIRLRQQQIDNFRMSEYEALADNVLPQGSYDNSPGS